MAKTRVRTSQDHAVMIQSPQDWPCWPMLPLKRRDPKNLSGPKQCAVLFEDQSQKDRYTVYLTNLYDIDANTDFTKLNQITYANAQDILADGWLVD